MAEGDYRSCHEVKGEVVTANSNVHLGDESNLARRVHLLREQRGWSAQELIRRMAAEGCEVPINAIGRIEAGQRAIRFNEALALANVFDIPLDELATLLPLVQDYKARRAMLASIARVERLFKDSARTVRALCEYLAILEEHEAETDTLVAQFAEWIDRRVRAMCPDPSDEDGAIYKATIDHLGELMLIAVQRRGSSNLLEQALQVLQMSRLLPPREEAPLSPEEQSLRDFADNDPEAFVQQAEEDRRELDELFPPDPERVAFWERQAQEFNERREQRGHAPFDLPLPGQDVGLDDGER